MFSIIADSVIHSLFVGQRQAFRRTQFCVPAPPRELGF
jgi:hypothetical protein